MEAKISPTSTRCAFLCAFLMLLLFLMALPIEAVDFGPHQVNFMGVRYDYPATGKSTWYYEVIDGRTGNAISHVTFGIGTCATILDAGKWYGPSDFNTLYSGQGSPEPGYFPATPKKDPTTNITGQKFNEEFEGDFPGPIKYYYYTLNGNYGVESTTMGVKYGATNDTGTIDGSSPTCDTTIKISLASFTATVAEQGVLLQWQVASEINHAGYNIYRSTSYDGEYTKLNSALIYKESQSSVEEKQYKYVDTDVKQGDLFYKLQDVSLDGQVTWHGPIQATVASNVESSIETPREFELSQNYPNPFNPATTISYALPERSHVALAIYDLNGRLVKTLVNEIQPVGDYSVVWDGTNEAGESVPSGLYFYQISAGEFQETERMTFLK